MEYMKIMFKANHMQLTFAHNPPKIQPIGKIDKTIKVEIPSVG